MSCEICKLQQFGPLHHPGTGHLLCRWFAHATEPVYHSKTGSQSSCNDCTPSEYPKSRSHSCTSAQVSLQASDESNDKTHNETSTRTKATSNQETPTEPLAHVLCVVWVPTIPFYKGKVASAMKSYQPTPIYIPAISSGKFINLFMGIPRTAYIITS